MARDFSIFIEQWRPILGYDGYEVSNYGRIRSLARLAKYKETLRSVPARFLKFQRGKHGYLMVTLYQNEKPKTLTVHKLVAQTFISRRPFGLFVHHIDHDKLNNHAWNLTYVTFHENLAHRNLCNGERHHSAKLRTGQIPVIRKLSRDGMDCGQISTIFNVSDATIYDIVKGKTWNHVI